MDYITIGTSTYYGIFDKVINEKNFDFVEVPNRLIVQSNGSYTKPKEINFEVFGNDVSGLNFSEIKSITNLQVLFARVCVQLRLIQQKKIYIFREPLHQDPQRFECTLCIQRSYDRFLQGA